MLAVRGRLIIGGFVADQWLPATQENFPDFEVTDESRYGFIGRPAPNNIVHLYGHKRVPDAYRFYGASFRYVDPTLKG